jgi:hypothetical protein
MEVIRPDSPFNRIPVALNDRQRLYLDGIRYSVEMFSTAYQRLADFLARYGDPRPPPQLSTAFLDAWSLIDSANRLRVLAESMPQLKKNAPPQQKLIRALRPAEDLRNGIQHLNGQIARMAKSEDYGPIWGTLAWVIYRPPTAYTYVAVAASLQPSNTVPFVNPLGRSFTPPVDFIQLSGYGFTARLSEMRYAISDWLAAIEAELAPQFGDSPHRPADMVARAEIDFPDDPNVVGERKAAKPRPRSRRPRD